MKNIKSFLTLNSEDRVLLIDSGRLPPFSEKFHRNIYKCDADGNVLWQVGKYKTSPVSTFVSIYIENGNLFGYNFDGGEYKIDQETGEVISSQLIR